MNAKQSKLIRSRRLRSAARTRAKIRGTAERPRLAVFRSLKHVSAQLIDDATQKTLLQANDGEVDKKLKGMARAAAVGTLVATRAKDKKIETVLFDRRHYRYHGQVKALADAAREGGLVF